MNARINKDVRVLLPYLAATVLAPLMAVLPLHFHIWEAIADLSTLLAAIGGVAMGAIVFGDEFSNRTMGLLLSQPIPRAKIWRGKMAVLGAALAICVIIMTFTLCLYVGKDLWGNPAELFSVVAFLLTFAAGIFCTTPFWTLAIKNMPGAMAAAFGAPIVLTVLIHVLVDYFPWLRWQGNSWDGDLWGGGGYLTVITLAIYFGGCYWLGRSMFLTLEVVESQGQEISLPAGLEKALARPLKMFSPGYGGPVRSLINKELRLQQVSFIMAILYCGVFFLGAAGWRLSTSEWALNLATVIMATGSALYLMLLPLIAGGVCVAEERNWGTLGYQLALPPSRLRQWIVKISIAMATSLVLGVLLPFVFYCVCQRLFHLPFDPFTNSESPLNAGDNMGYLKLVVFTFLLSGVAIYASSLATNTLRAILLTIFLIIAGGTTIMLSMFAGVRTVTAMAFFMREFSSHTPVLGISPAVIAEGTLLIISVGISFLIVPIMFIYFGFTNFRTIQISARRQWMQPALIVALMAASVFVFTIACGD